MPRSSKHTIAIIGLGYVGLPLAVKIGEKYRTVGFDNNPTRINELKAGRDVTLEATGAALKAARKLRFSSQTKDLESCNVFIVTVPTPIDQYKRPDLRPLLKASETVGRALKKGDVVIFESTVYPGCTEEICVPALERAFIAALQQGLLTVVTVPSASIPATSNIAWRPSGKSPPAPRRG